MLKDQNIRVFVDISWFEINGLNPDEIIGTDRIVMKGSASPSGRTSKMSNVCFASNPDVAFSDLEKHWDNIQKMLDGNATIMEIFEKQADRHQITIETVKFPEFPVLSIPLKMIEFAAKVNSTIALDVYDYL